ncbi:MAG: hydrogenase formation protein HypD [Candidatus Marinimicrobia bacterium]|nr:hydrogenase formation protein HypD [Candidatus Neomarinimicrobiota bacterium]MBL7031252.1 hydrogenase formation protein HypD [Candidatus Neomarinimicrobiota bacterium]
MKYLDEYRDRDTVLKLVDEIHKITKQKWTIMEMCGGQTHSIIRYGIDELIPDKIRLVHGPGCPVCVTPIEMIDKALEITAQPNVIFTSFGDMLRVPGSNGDLFSVKAKGGDVRIVYSPMDAVELAKNNPENDVVFFGVGFETTAPANAMSVVAAKSQELKNFSVLISHVLVPPAIEAILQSEKNEVQGFLAAGHVCTIMGYEEYVPLCETYKVPIVVTGFEPVDLLQGILMTIKQLESGQYKVDNQYTRSVSQQGNDPAQKVLQDVFRVVPRKWRGIGEIPMSGWTLTDKYTNFDAEKKFGVIHTTADEPADCISGDILMGHKRPNECSAFGTRCTPENPFGATMVSAEGACAAYYKYHRFQTELA